MQKILLFGAGRSATILIEYLIVQAEQQDWSMTVVDANIDMARAKIGQTTNAKAIELDIYNQVERRRLIEQHDLTISLLPAHLHMIVAEDCYDIGRHLCTASYVSDEMESLAKKASEKGLIFMGELGLDPGLDHMSAMACIHELREKGAQLLGFESYTGGLVAPESDDNAWHYKISWNPRNVVLAGRGMSTYLLDGMLKYIPYHRLFQRHEIVDIEGVGPYEMYVNRDSVSYRSIYGLDEIPTIVRGTLRHTGYCDAWHALVSMGYTDDSVEIPGLDTMTIRDVTASLLPIGEGSIVERLASYLGQEEGSDVMNKLNELGLCDPQPIRQQSGSPATVLEELITKRWVLRPNDKDMILMQHVFTYQLNGAKHTLISTLKEVGENAIHTAMSRLVGLPLAIFARLVMEGRVAASGQVRPVTPDIYAPILQELLEHNVVFKETHRTNH